MRGSVHMTWLRAIPLLLFPGDPLWRHGDVHGAWRGARLARSDFSGAQSAQRRDFHRHPRPRAHHARGWLALSRSREVDEHIDRILVENVLAFIVFIFAFILFLLNPAFGTIEFALIMTMMLIDFMAGFIVLTVSSRRDVSWA
jgi:hypothetical protein